MKRMWLASIVGFALIAVACTGGGTETSTGQTPAGGPVELIMWHGYGRLAAPGEEPNFEYNSISSLVDEYNKVNPNVHITLRYVNSDFALQKLTVALQGGEAPDISYQYGTNMAQVATSPNILDLTDRVSDPTYNWEDFFPGERAVATVDGRVLGIPALVDNLAVVYNKHLFSEAGLPEPSADWTWDDLVQAAKALTDPAKKQFGLAFPADGSETTVWEYEAMLWEAGGDILNSDNTKAVFNSPAGVQALSVLQELTQAGAIYKDFHPDAGRSEQLFNSGNIGMIITGPWDLSTFPDVKYGVRIMPSFAPGGDHTTIAGPDNWVVFDNGPDRVEAAWAFLKWFTSPQQVLQDSMDTGHLPTRASVEGMPGFANFDTKYGGVGTFVDNLANVVKARPSIVAYPQVSEALGQAIQKILLGQSDPQTALNAAAEQANGILAVPA